jgi:hypothetical protein
MMRGEGTERGDPVTHQKMTEQEKLLKGYRLRIEAAMAQMDLEITYADDGAPDSAARCAETAVEFLREAATLKMAAFGQKKAAKG